MTIRNFLTAALIGMAAAGVTPARATITNGELISSAGVSWKVIDCGSTYFCDYYTLSAIWGGVEIAYTGPSVDPTHRPTPDISPVLETTSSVSFVSFTIGNGNGSLIISTDEDFIQPEQEVALLDADESSSFTVPSSLYSYLYWYTDIPYSQAPYSFVTQVPEPASLAVLGFGFAILAGVRGRRSAA